MRKNLLAVVSAVLCGILAMFIPLCVWHQVNFPGKPLTFGSLGEAMRSLDSYTTSLEDLSMTPFYLAFILSFAVSTVAYVFSKRRV
ncbi:MAG: hypothetical protein OEY22_11980 [Candidatus Bathyarchaeota archaeon]|nr:hypothetical protein [Candidatus Bathyarchaeota archaeon]